MIRLLSVALTLVALSAVSAAQTGEAGWPERPMRLLVPFPAGASTDIIARIIAQKLAHRLGQQIVVENRAGASGNIGADAVAKAAPDGTTIGIATASTHAVAASLSANPANIEKGQSTTLTWRTENATEVSIDGVGRVQPSGSQDVSPADSTNGISVTCR